jgi:hypothetical protein
MNTKWFKQKNGIYFPIHPLGYLITGMSILFLVPIIISIDRNAHSLSDFFYEVFIYGTCTVFWWKWIAEKTSE